MRLALWTVVAQLVGWDMELGRRSGGSLPAALAAGLVNGAFGLLIVVLEALLH